MPHWLAFTLNEALLTMARPMRHGWASVAEAMLSRLILRLYWQLPCCSPAVRSLALTQL